MRCVTFEGRSCLGWHRHVTLASLGQVIRTQLRRTPKKPCAALTLYAVLREFQTLLALWTGACHTCRQPVQTTTTPDEKALLNSA